jgi:hypothetical protein
MLEIAREELQDLMFSQAFLMTTMLPFGHLQ